MTLAEAEEAGMLAAALQVVQDTRAEMDIDDHTEFGFGLAVDHSDLGSSGFGWDAIVPRAIAQQVMMDAMHRIATRLRELDVDPSPTPKEP